MTQKYALEFSMSNDKRIFGMERLADVSETNEMTNAPMDSVDNRYNNCPSSVRSSVNDNNEWVVIEGLNREMRFNMNDPMK